MAAREETMQRASWLVVAAALGAACGGGDGGEAGGDTNVVPDAFTDTDSDTPPDAEGSDDDATAGSDAADVQADAPDDVADAADAVDGGDDVDDGSGVLASGVVTVEGGRVFGGGVEIRVPFGAVDDDVVLTVRRSTEAVGAGYDVVAGPFEFGPEGTSFAVPVTVCFETAEELLASAPVTLLWGESGPDPLVGRTAVRFEARVWCGAVTHFTPGALVRRPNCPPTAQLLCNSGACVAGPAECAPGCPFGGAPCGDVACVNLLVDTANCGACGVACADGEECRGGGCFCPAETPVRCGTGVCVASPDDCACSVGLVRCPDGRCVDALAECEGGGCDAGLTRCGDGTCQTECPCDAATPYRCPNRSCATGFEACEICPVETPVRCPEGVCRASADDCTEGCSGDRGYLCPSGGCSFNSSACVYDAPCPEGTGFRCNDASCSTWDGAQCDDGPCSYFSPIQCGDTAHCVSDIAACPPALRCPSDRPTLCPTGQCVAGECPPCPAGRPVECPSGACEVLLDDCR